MVDFVFDFVVKLGFVLVLLSIFLFLVAPYQLLAIWTVLLLYHVPPASRTVLYAAVLMGIMRANYNNISKLDTAAMAERTTLPPLGLSRQVTTIIK